MNENNTHTHTHKFFRIAGLSCQEISFLIFHRAANSVYLRAGPTE